jgi:hypothetical protein
MNQRSRLGEPESRRKRETFNTKCTASFYYFPVSLYYFPVSLYCFQHRVHCITSCVIPKKWKTITAQYLSALRPFSLPHPPIIPALIVTLTLTAGN